MRSLQATAQALHTFRQLVAQELLDRAMDMLARAGPASTAARKMLLRMKHFDSKSAAKHAPVLLQIIFEHSDPTVRPDPLFDLRVRDAANRCSGGRSALKLSPRRARRRYGRMRRTSPATTFRVRRL